jgi:hypothetical protein
MKIPFCVSRRQMLRSGFALAAATSVKGWGSVRIIGSTGSIGSDASSPGSNSGSAASGSENPQLVPSGPMTVASLTVTTLAAGSIGPAFAGLSYEKAALQWSFFSASNVVGISLFQGLGTSVLRLGGSSVDQSVWTPNGAGRTYLQVAPSDVASLAAFIKATGWQCLYGINLGGAATGATTPALAAAEVAYAVEQFGSSCLVSRSATSLTPTETREIFLQETGRWPTILRFGGSFAPRFWRALQACRLPRPPRPTTCPLGLSLLGKQ